MRAQQQARGEPMESPPPPDSEEWGATLGQPGRRRGAKLLAGTVLAPAPLGAV